MRRAYMRSMLPFDYDYSQDTHNYSERYYPESDQCRNALWFSFPLANPLTTHRSTTRRTT